MQVPRWLGLRRPGAGGIFAMDMTRIDYDHDEEPGAPRANSLVPGASAVVVDRDGRILLHRRSDNRLWSIPGGAMEVGESIAETVVREVREETGLSVEPQRLVGIYSNPRRVIAYADGEVRQEFSVCFACRPVGGRLVDRTDETLEVGFFTREQIATMPMHSSIRLRITDYLERHAEPVIA
jgi:ADP-ribose pyrophosphatase YjhB (NUDIX family)